ncbi:NADH-quinone oxidoreductase subunit J [Alkalilimnicola sp. S0819]|uniref:NADH-quinone oxidoreductase subunit J n=1 Tax=Alkalilimnicola sp. S0819 TaxID=2613922 RepID=UPI001262AA07|nr:NADH-quinone oxidoreductase subunit J [Alkalilimnicola sp. S0819]KAB7628434.1 NADH-quinone oxidoreductase subunit J [Alkalilimnicola sp. S0819]MPQ15338.1 NADH-quinone oxidoreductase subunit J [Alkalilimnicola sp. S0819]
MQLVLFYIFAAVLLFAAVMVISSRNPVHSAMFLVLAFFNSAALWLLAEAEFLGVALVLVYVGAVMVLFLFVVMMLDINAVVLREGFARYLPVGLAVAVVMVLEMVLVVGADQIDALVRDVPPVAEPAVNNIAAIGGVLYTEYLYPFEIAAVVLLVAIIAATMLTHRRRADSKKQNAGKQVRTRKADRLRIVKMPAAGGNKE